VKVADRDDVVAVEHAASLVACDRHGHALGHAAPYEVAYDGTARTNRLGVRTSARR
jgi:hypothetical protein